MHKVFYRGLAIVVTGMMLLVGCLWLLNTAQAAKRESSSPFFSSGATGGCILLDDFKDGDFQNYRGGNGYWWGIEGGSISCSVHTLVNDGFLEMQYDVTAPEAYALFSSPLISLNLTACDTVWVAVKGEDGSEPIYVELQDCGLSGAPQFPKEIISDHLAQGIITSEYSAVAIPLGQFSDITDWSCIERLNILASSKITSGQGKIYVDELRFLPPRVLVDDFHDVKTENELGGTSGTWEVNSGTIVYDYPDGVLELDYDTTATTPTAEAGYWTKLRYTNLLLQKDVIFFKVRGDQGSEEMVVEFKDCGLGGPIHYPKIKTSDYLAGGITTTWRGVAIPLAAFADGMDWTCIEQMSFNFSAHPWFNSGQGKVYVGNVILAPTSRPVPLIVDHFDDCNDWNAMVGAWSGDTNGTATIDLGPDPVHRYGDRGCGYRITYDVEGSSSAWVRSELKGLDVTDYTFLRFFLKGAAGGEALHVYLKSKDGKERYYEEEDILAGEDWQEWLLPLSDFSPTVSLTNLSELKIAFEWRPMAGEVYLDNISFMKPVTSFLPIAMKDYCTENYEPNDSCQEAYGPLTSGQTYRSWITQCDLATPKKSDYFYVDISTTNTIKIYLTNIPPSTDYDLYLYSNELCDDPVAEAKGTADWEGISYTPPTTGTYYIRVYSYRGSSASPYSLRVTYD